MRRIYDTLARTHSFKPHYSVCLNAECRAWWCTFLRAWNGASILRPLQASSPDFEFWSDASGGWGCGANWQGMWFQVPWGLLPIASKELFPIVLAAIGWGHVWRGCTVLCCCDNMAVVEVINRHSAKDPLLAHHLRCLFFACAHHNFDHRGLHCHALSATTTFLPSSPRFPTHLLGRRQFPQISACMGLSVSRPSWNSQDWTAWFSSTYATR